MEIDADDGAEAGDAYGAFELPIAEQNAAGNGKAAEDHGDPERCPAPLQGRHIFTIAN
jgi:hypothetical protein